MSRRARSKRARSFMRTSRAWIAASNYLAQLGRTLAGKAGASPGEDIRVAMNAIRVYEQSLSLELLLC